MRKTAIIIISVWFVLFNIESQTISHFFSRDIPLRHVLNPAFQPVSKYYISLPVIGNTEFGYYNTSFSLKNIVEKDLNGFYAGLTPKNLISVNSNINFLSAGIGINNTYLNFNISQRALAHVNLPSDFYKLLIYGTPEKYNNIYNLNTLGFSGEFFTETAFGISQQFDEQWTFGIKLKLLTGNASIKFSTEKLYIKGAVDSWNLSGQSSFAYSGAANAHTDKITDIQNISYPRSVSDWLKPHGLGAGIDFGVHFRMLQNLFFSASITDLSFIKWNKNIIHNNLSIDYNFDGIVKLNSTMNKDQLGSALSQFNNISNSVDSLLNDLKSSIQNQTLSTFTTHLNPTINLAAEYRFLSDKITTGLVYNAVLYPETTANRLTAIVNYSPFDKLNTTLSYSFLNGYNGLGAGINFKLGVVSFFSYADIINFNFARIKSAGSWIPFPYTGKSFNFTAGINIAFGKRVKISDYLTNQRYNPRNGLYKPRFKKSIFNWTY